MVKAAFLITGDRVVHIANSSGAGFQYHAHAKALAPGAGVAARRHHGAETVLLVEEGIIEAMVGGATAYVKAGNFVRISPGTDFAYRNAGSGPARLLLRASLQRETADSRFVTLQFAAA